MLRLFEKKKKSVQIGQYQTKSGQEHLAHKPGKRHIKKVWKQRNHQTGYGVKPHWLPVIGCPQHFDFLTVRYLQAEISVC